MMTSSPSPITLVILAAGMGSRYGGMKQLDLMGPYGETIMDYALYDAIRSGFDKVVFVIREDFAAQFKTAVSQKYASKIDVSHAYQTLDAYLGGFQLPDDRTKPWGTGHALLCAKDHIDGAFAVINADDFYGHDGMQKAASYLRELTTHEEGAMISYLLKNTLSDHGSVNRGVCTVDHLGVLTSIQEHTAIARSSDDEVYGINPSEQKVLLDEDSEVSMNFWALPHDVLDDLNSAFQSFLSRSRTVEKSEFYLPAFIDDQIKKGQLTIKTLPSSGMWHGVTYQDDKPIVQSALRLLHGESYPEHSLFA